MAELFKIPFRDSHRQHVEAGRRNRLQFIVFREDGYAVCGTGGSTPSERYSQRMRDGQSVALRSGLAPLVHGPAEPAFSDLHLLVAKLHERSLEPAWLKQYKVEIPIFLYRGEQLKIGKLSGSQKWSHLCALLPIFDVVGVF